MIFNQVISNRTREERQELARRIASYSLIVLLASLLLGGIVLNFFGVSLSALRIGGGLVVAVRAWGLLMQPEVHEERKATSAEPAQSADDVAFFPLTMPLTTGPGTIAVAIALSSQRPGGDGGVISFFAGVSLAAACIAVTIWLCYRWSDTVTALLGPAGARVLSRLVAFLLLCIGVQIMITGVVGVGQLLLSSR
ncbi:MarC family protein [Sphingomonas panacis]|uniref:MarC family protein n=1 Tax=Sphingomonas panacis TaxID=1560345 RepID=UPI001F0A2BDD|nr:MarC family protein [Sphingomonas panacis]